MFRQGEFKGSREALATEPPQLSSTSVRELKTNGSEV